jgi:tight adherence protein B
MDGLFWTIFAVLLFIVGTTSWFAYQVMVSTRKREVMQQLGGRGTFGAESPAPTNVFIDKSQLKSQADSNPLLSLQRYLGRRAVSAGLDWTGGKVLTAMFGGAAAGVVVGLYYPILIFRSVTAIVLAVFFAVSPLIYISFKRSKRLAMFEEQFPEALDFIARALRAGHAFSMSLEMLANDSPEPLSIEFRRVYQEQNLGSPMETTLLGLAERVPIVDVKFFVSAVLLQREAGGNLSEILTNLAHTVRERFRLKGHIKAATAHARITAVILTALPFVVLLLLQAQNPAYLKGFLAFDEGPWLLLGALAAQVAGYYLMRRLINFRI